MIEETRWVGGGAATLGVLATVGSLGPDAAVAVDVVVLVTLGLGVLAGLVGHRVHVLRIRRGIEAREARGVSLLRRVEPTGLPSSHQRSNRRHRR